MIEGALIVTIVLAAIAGSVGFIGNGLYFERHGRDHRVLRLARNIGVPVIWPLLIIRAFM